MKKKITAYIPAHLASVRFPQKVLHKIHGLEMIEHVRRRAIISQAFDDVVVATCDQEVISLINGYGGKVVQTSNRHKNGTSRIAEAVRTDDCSHVVLLQADEPLLLPEDLQLFCQVIKSSNENTVSWNATGPIENPDELDRHSFVKCFVNKNNTIQFCFRRSPAFAEFEKTRGYIRKILGIIGYEKNFLLKLSELPQGDFENNEFIEQMRIVENEYILKSVPLDHTLPSINEPSEVNEVMKKISTDENQKKYLERVLSF